MLPKYDHHTKGKMLKLQPMPTIIGLENNSCDEVLPLNGSEVDPVDHPTLDS